MRTLGRVLVLAGLAPLLVLVGQLAWLAQGGPIGFADELAVGEVPTYAAETATLVRVGLFGLIVAGLVACAVLVWRYHRTGAIGRRAAWALVGLIMAANLMLVTEALWIGTFWPVGAILSSATAALFAGALITRAAEVESSAAALA